jgi:colicin import membrane protein
MRLRHLAAVVLAVLSAPAVRAADLNVITSVDVKDEGATLVLSVRGSKKPSFTTFSMAEPPRFVIDFSESRFEGVPETLPVQDGTINVVKSLSYGSDATSIARVMIAFAVEVAPPDVTDAGETLVVRIAKPAGAASAAVATRTEDDQSAGKARVDAEAKAAAEATRREREDEEARARVEAELRARADAEARAQADAEKQARADAEAQAKADAPSKADADARAEADRRAADEARAASEREAEASAARARDAEEQKTRADAEAQRAAAVAQANRGGEPVDDERDEADAREVRARAVEKARAELEVEAKAQVAAERAAAQAEVEAAPADAEPAPAAEPERHAAAPASATAAEPSGRLEVGAPAARLREVGFKQLAGVSRVYVRTSVTPRFTIQDVGQDTIRVQLENTRVDRKNDLRFLDTSFFPSAVAMIQPARDGSSYVLEIKLRERVPYQQRIEGDLLAIDFERPASAARAAAPGALVPAAADAAAEPEVEPGR